MCREQQNVNERIRVVAVKSDATGATSATIALAIMRKSDGQFWDGATFGASFNTVPMTELDATNLPGHYIYDFDTSGLPDDVYHLSATSSTLEVVNDPWYGELKVGGFVDNIDAAVSAVKDQIVEAEGTYTIKQALSIILAAVAGRTTDAGLTFKTPNNNATRIAATVNASDERTAITLTPSA